MAQSRFKKDNVPKNDLKTSIDSSICSNPLNDQCKTNQNSNQTTWEAQHGEQLGFKSRKLLSNFALRLPVIITVPRTDAWLKTGLPVETWSKVTL